jgi:8-oxo-dGTP pyrophosphatase MutT (NUDIX family)
MGEMSNAWYTPGGGMDPGETPELCAVRELHEETGLEPTGPLELIDVVPMHVYGNDAFNVSFTCACDAGEVQLSEEHAGFRWIDPRDYRARYFEGPKVEELIARDPRRGALVAAVRRELDGFLTWLERQR